ncbi:MAG: cytochrome c biogenesis protein ResB, partial [Bdellovibrionales bacterium]|nr:cytochrome c biogenesis protein ResB [Bdellovibrionales bacterium]
MLNLKTMKKSSQPLIVIFQVLASVKTAVIIIVAMTILSIWGTLVESKYDAKTAQETVYHGFYMYSTLILLCANLIFSMIERWPWKSRHLPFLLAHFGILILMAGSYVTRVKGVDGSMVFRFGESKNWISIADTYVNVFEEKTSALTVGAPLLSKKVRYMHSGPEEDLTSIELDGEKMSVTSYYPYAIREDKVEPSEDPSDGPSVRFVLQNSFATISKWVTQSGADVGVANFGPARVLLFKSDWFNGGGNEILLKPAKGRPGHLQYRINSEKHPTKEGFVKAGESIKTPWMDMVLRMLKYEPRSKSVVHYTPLAKPKEGSSEAIQVTFAGTKKWIGLNNYTRFENKGRVFVVSFANQKVPIGVDMKLKNFEVGRYPGSQMAMSYQSVVEVDGEEHLISMNEPFKKSGFTFYQASFQDDESGKPYLSVLSVNYDPGRILK